MTQEDRLDGEFNARKQSDESVENAVTVSVVGPLTAPPPTRTREEAETVSEAEVDAVARMIESAGSVGIAPNELVVSTMSDLLCLRC